MDDSDPRNACLNRALELSTFFLNEQKEFMPFGVSVNGEGKLGFHEGPAGDLPATPEGLIDKISGDLKSGRDEGDLLAVGICADVHITHPATQEETDAVQVFLEDRTGFVRYIYMPYAQGAEGLECQTLFASPADARVFCD